MLRFENGKKSAWHRRCGVVALWRANKPTYGGPRQGGDLGFLRHGSRKHHFGTVNRNAHLSGLPVRYRDPSLLWLEISIGRSRFSRLGPGWRSTQRRVPPPGHHRPGIANTEILLAAQGPPTRFVPANSRNRIPIVLGERAGAPNGFRMELGPGRLWQRSASWPESPGAPRSEPPAAVVPKRSVIYSTLTKEVSL
jgi:hypothetical protein